MSNEIYRKQQEINRLRKVLHSIADSRPDEHMDIDKLPELTNWICDTCTKASVEAYPKTQIKAFKKEGYGLTELYPLCREALKEYT